MALNSSGAISLAGSTAGQSISNEFRSITTSTTSLSEYYRGGTYVGPHNGPVPTSGAISIGSFYGAAKRNIKTITYTSNASNVNIQTSSVSGYSAGWTDLEVAVSSGVTISASGGNSALSIASGFASGDTIYINNYGTIAGQGGNGGNAGANGGAGYPAINLNPASYANVRITNQSGAIIAGGGGGGGGGMAATATVPSGYSYASGSVRGGGGGGGAGQTAGSGGSYGGYSISTGPYWSTTSNGGAGSATAGGAASGYDGIYYYSVNNYYLLAGGAGGAGGARGANGSAGGQAYFNGPGGVTYIAQSTSPGTYYPPTGATGTMQSGYPVGSGGAAGYGITGTNKLSQPTTNNGTIYGPTG